MVFIIVLNFYNLINEIVVCHFKLEIDNCIRIPEISNSILEKGM